MEIVTGSALVSCVAIQVLKWLEESSDDSKKSAVSLLNSILMETAGTISGGVLGNASDREALAMNKRLKEALAGGQLPPNHDIERAAQRAFKQALLVLLCDYFQHCGLSLPMRARLREEKSLKRFAEWFARIADQLPGSDEGGITQRWLRKVMSKVLNSKPEEAWPDFGAFITPGPELAAGLWEDPIGVFAPQIHAYAERWLRKAGAGWEGGEELLKWMREGRSAKRSGPKVDGATEPRHLTLAMYWSECFRWELKHDRAAGMASLFHTLARLVSGQEASQQKLKAIEQQLKDQHGELRQRLQELVPVSEQATVMIDCARDLELALRRIEPVLVRIEAAAEKPSAEALAAEFMQRLWSQYAPPLLLQRKVIRREDPPDLHALLYNERWLDYERHGEPEDRLDDFLATDAPFSWWLVQGEGGVGKSRLALELCLRAETDAWEAGFLLDDKWLENGLVHWQATRPTLIVIDYAADGSGRVIGALHHLADRAKHGVASTSLEAERAEKVRVLLLERPGRLKNLQKIGVGQGLRAEGMLKAELVACLHTAPVAEAPCAAEFVQSEDLSTMVMRQAMTLAPVDTAEALRLRLGKVLTRLGSIEKLPAVTETEFWATISRLTDGGRWLYLQLLGICVVEEHLELRRIVSEDVQTNLLDDILRRERGRRWRQLFVSDKFPGMTEETFLDTVERAVGFVTLCRGLDLGIPQERKALAQVVGPEGKVLPFPPVLRAILGGHVGNGVLCPLAPDLVGERLLLRLLMPSPRGTVETLEDDFPVDEKGWIELASGFASDRVARTLELLCSDFREDPYRVRWTWAFLNGVDWIESSRSSKQCAIDQEEAAGRLAADLMELDGAAEMAHAWVERNWPVIGWDHSAIARGFVYGAILQRVAGLHGVAFSLLYEKGRKWLENSYESFPSGAFALYMYGLWNGAPGLTESEEGTLLRLAEAFRLRFTGLEQTQSEEKDAALNAFIHACKNGDNDAIRQSLLGITRVTEISELLEALAYMAVNAMIHHRNKNNNDAMELWGEELRRVAAARPGEQVIQTRFAKGAINAIIHYCEVSDWVAVERWGEELKRVAAAQPEDTDIQLSLSKISLEAMGYYHEVGDREAEERWSEELKLVAQRLPHVVEIQLDLAKAALNLMTYSIASNRLAEFGVWAKELKQVALSHPEEPEAQLLLAKGAVNAMNFHGEAERWTELEEWGNELRSAQTSSVFIEEARALMAQGAFKAMHDYGAKNLLSELEVWGTALRAVAEANPQVSEIQLWLARGAQCAIEAYAQQSAEGRKNCWQDVERWGAELKRVAMGQAAVAEIEMMLVEVAFGALIYYAREGQEDRWQELEAWGEELKRVAAARPGEQEIQTCFAKGAINAMVAYTREGQEDRWQKLEAWGEELKRLAAAWPGEREIQSMRAYGALHAFVCYSREGQEDRSHELKRWEEEFKLVACMFPDEIWFGKLTQWAVYLLSQGADPRQFVPMVHAAMQGWPGYVCKWVKGKTYNFCQMLTMLDQVPVDLKEIAGNYVSEVVSVGEKADQVLAEAEPAEADIRWLIERRKYLPDFGAALIERFGTQP